MSADVDLDYKIARRAAVLSVIALTAYHNTLSVPDTCRDGYRDRLRHPHLSGAAAGRAGVLYDLARTVAGLARNGGLELHTAESLRHTALTGTAARRARLGGGTLFGSAAAAVCAFTNAREADIPLYAEHSLLKIYGNRNAYIIAAHGTVAARRGRLTEAAAEKRRKDIADITEISRGEAARIAAASAASHASVKRRVTVAVIRRTLVGVGKYSVSLVHLLELRLGCFVAGMKVGVILLCHLAVGFFYCIFIGAALDAQHLIVISFSFCHRSAP